MDRLLDAARQERDGAAYQELVKQFVKIAMTDVPVIPLYQPVLDVTMQRSIDGYVYQFHRQVDARTLIRT
jgi:peptide/nickel transport system substrate-binding protein